MFNCGSEAIDTSKRNIHEYILTIVVVEINIFIVDISMLIVSLVIIILYFRKTLLNITFVALNENGRTRNIILTGKIYLIVHFPSKSYVYV